MAESWNNGVYYFKLALYEKAEVLSLCTSAPAHGAGCLPLDPWPPMGTSAGPQYCRTPATEGCGPTAVQVGASVAKDVSVCHRPPP